MKWGVLLCFFLGSLLWGQPSPELQVPPLNTDIDKLRFLLFIKENSPELFNDAGAYGNDILGLLEAQSELQKKLLTMDGYAEAMEARKNPLQINLSAKAGTNSQVSVVVANEKTIESYRSELVESFAQIKKDLPEGADFSDELHKSIRNLASGVLRESIHFNSALGGLMSTLSSEAKEKVMKIKAAHQSANPEQASSFVMQLEYIREVMGAERTLANNFDFKRAGLNKQKFKTYAELCLYLKEKFLEKEKFFKLLSLGAILQQTKLKSVEELKAFLSGVDRSHLDRLEDVDHVLSPYLKNQLGENDIAKPLVGFQENLAKHKKHDAIERRVIKNLELRQSPVYEASFRSCVTRDCSSEYSFASPNAPDERIFYVYDPQGTKARGAVTSRIILHGTKKYLQVNTIAGSRIGPEDVCSIVESLYLARDSLGVENIILPKNSALHGLINQPLLREAFAKLVREGTPLEGELDFADTTYRRVVDAYAPYNYHGYDKMSSNRQGVLYKPQNQLGEALDVKVQQGSFRSIQMPELNAADTFDLVLQMHTAGYDKVVSRLIVAGNLPEAKTRNFLGLINNKKNLKLLEYEHQLQEASNKVLGPPFELSEYRKINPHVFMEGVLRASDAWSDENRVATTELYVKDIVDAEGTNESFGGKLYFDQHLPDIARSEKDILKLVVSLGAVVADRPDIEAVSKLRAALPLCSPSNFKNALLQMMPFVKGENESLLENFPKIFADVSPAVLKEHSQELVPFLWNLIEKNPESQKIESVVSLLQHLDIPIDIQDKIIERLLRHRSEGEHPLFPVLKNKALGERFVKNNASSFVSDAQGSSHPIYDPWFLGRVFDIGLAYHREPQVPSFVNEVIGHEAQRLNQKLHSEVKTPEADRGRGLYWTLHALSSLTEKAPQSVQLIPAANATTLFDLMNGEDESVVHQVGDVILQSMRKNKKISETLLSDERLFHFLEAKMSPKLSIFNATNLHYLGQSLLGEIIFRNPQNTRAIELSRKLLSFPTDSQAVANLFAAIEYSQFLRQGDQEALAQEPSFAWPLVDELSKHVSEEYNSQKLNDIFINLFDENPERLLFESSSETLSRIFELHDMRPGAVESFREHVVSYFLDSKNESLLLRALHEERIKPLLGDLFSHSLRLSPRANDSLIAARKKAGVSFFDQSRHTGRGIKENIKSSVDKLSGACSRAVSAMRKAFK